MTGPGARRDTGRGERTAAQGDGTATIATAPDHCSGVLGRVYVAIGDPGVIDLFESARLRHLETVPTERGAHTIAVDISCHRVYALLPESHPAAVYVDGWGGAGAPGHARAVLNRS